MHAGNAQPAKRCVEWIGSSAEWSGVEGRLIIDEHIEGRLDAPATDIRSDDHDANTMTCNGILNTERLSVGLNGYRHSLIEDGWLFQFCLDGY